MNYLTEIKLFYDWLETHPMTPSAIALWHGLMFIANRQGWEDVITIPLSVLESRTGIPSTTLYRIRKQLQEAELIEVLSPAYTGFGSSSRKQISLRCSRLVEEPAQLIGFYHLSHVLLSKMGNKMKDKWKTKMKSDGNRASLLSKMENKMRVLLRLNRMLMFLIRKNMQKRNLHSRWMNGWPLWNLPGANS